MLEKQDVLGFVVFGMNHETSLEGANLRKVISQNLLIYKGNMSFMKLFFIRLT